MPASKISNFLLEITVFICGALVMIYEIIGSRLLAPYIGASTYVWTSLIGVILAALSLGYWLGGKIADRKPDVKILAAVIFGAGGFVSVTILLKDLILSLLSTAPLGLEIKSVIAALLLFAPASILLGFVTPYAVKLKLAKFEDAGKTVGRLYALSTIGSIFGTFAAGFLLIPFVGSVRTLYLIGAALMGLSLLLAPFVFSRLNFSILTVFVFGIISTELQNFYLYRTIALHDIDTEYSRVRIFETKDDASGKQIRALVIDPYIIQSKMYLDSDELASEYLKFYHLIKHFKPDFQKTLLIGGAGYSFPKSYLKTYPEKKLDVVEFDPQMTALAKKHFRLAEHPNLRIFHEDGRIYLNHAQNARYDAVLIDAFGSLFSIPFQLTTIESAHETHRILKEDGVAIFNVGGAITGKSSRFLQAELAVYKSVFPQVFLFKVKPEKPDHEVQNFIIIALKKDAEISFTSPDKIISQMLMQKIDFLLEPDLVPLTDDLAPVEFYNSFSGSVF